MSFFIIYEFGQYYNISNYINIKNAYIQLEIRSPRDLMNYEDKS